MEGSSVKCQERCQQTDGCGAFSYATGTYDGVHGKRIRQRCFLKIKGVTLDSVDQENVVSGPRDCPSKCYTAASVIFLFQIKSLQIY